MKQMKQMSVKQKALIGSCQEVFYITSTKLTNTEDVKTAKEHLEFAKFFIDSVLKNLDEKQNDGTMSVLCQR